MTQSSSSFLRSGSRAGTGASGAPTDEPRVPLRLTVTRGLLGLELYEPVDLGPLEVSSAAVSLPNLPYPVDLSGGVRTFRHRRGELEQLRVASSLDALGRWLHVRFRDGLGGLIRQPSIWPVGVGGRVDASMVEAPPGALGSLQEPQGLAVGITGRRGAAAFELLWAPSDGDARWVVARARGADLDGIALAVALDVVDTLLGGVARRRGRLVTVAQAAGAVSRAVFPAVGARTPDAARVRLGMLSVSGDRIEVEADSRYPHAAYPDDVLRALELAELTAPADDALAAGRLDEAREGYMAALERAPRHPEIARLVAAIDLHAGGRAEAALSMIGECMPVVESGAIGADLLVRTGDVGAAVHAFEAAAAAEPYAPIAALLWKRVGDLAESSRDRLAALDKAVARAPGLAAVRWARFAARVERGDVEAAVADAEHLEAAAVGGHARHEVCRRAARHLLEGGFSRDAGHLYERALRYVPDDALATAGLARAFIEVGRTKRGLALLERAISLGERSGRPEPDALLDLAKLLATELGDLPQAVARVREVPATVPRAAEARALEGRWRAELGDLAGATLAFARLREAVELAAPAPRDAAGWLLEAARFEKDVQRDPESAERHLAVALRIAPRDREVAERYREVAAVVARRTRQTTTGDGGPLGGG